MRVEKFCLFAKNLCLKNLLLSVGIFLKRVPSMAGKNKSPPCYGKPKMILERIAMPENVQLFPSDKILVPSDKLANPVFK